MFEQLKFKGIPVVHGDPRKLHHKASTSFLVYFVFQWRYKHGQVLRLNNGF